MSRLELYKRKRRHKRLVLFTMLISIILVIIGLSIVDIAVNNMLGVSGSELRIFSLVKKQDSIYQLRVFSYTDEINLSYIKKDITRILDWGKQLQHELKECILYLYN